MSIAANYYSMFQASTRHIGRRVRGSEASGHGFANLSWRLLGIRAWQRLIRG